MKKSGAEPTSGTLWKIALVFWSLLFFTVLELNKNTIAGWLYAAAAVVLFALIRARIKTLPHISRPKDGPKPKTYGKIKFLLWVVLFAAFAGILFMTWPPVKPVPAVSYSHPQVTDVVHLDQGDLTGVLTKDGAVEVYAGIPYAAPPVGDLRWREPQKAEPWEGILAADHFAPMSMQTVNQPIYDSLAQIIGYHDYRISLTDNYRAPVSEDSLYVNIWKPAGPKKDLPVLVYIHGGSLQTGQPWYADYSGEGLARRDVIVVNMGYRLGIFGFFADEELAAESPLGSTGNYGLLDQIAALEWVRDNIAAFGGDPSNVTLAGESAGAACVTALSVSPLAKGLFKRILVESSTVTAPKPAHSFRLFDEAIETSAATKKKFRVTSADQLREAPAKDLADELSVHHHITVDGVVLPETPYALRLKGIHNEEAVLHGFNREEAAPFQLFSPGKLSNYEERVRGAFEPPYDDEVLYLYPASDDAGAKKNWADINTALLFSYGHYCLERQAASVDEPSYMYYFTRDNGRLGAWHSGEEVYFYGTIPARSRLYTASDRALSDTIVQYVVNFARNGDPNGEGLPAWPAGRDGHTVLQLDETVETVETPYLDLYGILDEMTGFEGGGRRSDKGGSE